MSKTNIHISEFTKCNDFYEDVNLLVTVKSFDLKAIRARYLKSKENKSKRTGSIERRAVTIGGIAKIKISKGSIIEENILNKLPEPRGIDGLNDIIALSSENKVFIIREGEIYLITNPWFSYIYTTKIYQNIPHRILISSSGFDCIFEYDYIKNEKTFEWFSWENGFNKGVDPETAEDLFLTRKPKEAEEFTEKGIHHLLIDDPESQVLPTSKRAAFINSVTYNTNTPNSILATFFHEGSVYEIDMKTSKATKVLGDLLNPHGGLTFGNEFMATSTKSGELVIGNIENQIRYNFNNLEGKDEVLGDFEWIQNSIYLNENIISIDSNRNSFVIFNPEKKLYDIINFNDNWAVQDIINIDENPNIEIISNLK